MDKTFYDSAEVRDSIAGRIEEIVKTLLPEVRIKGKEGRVGGLDNSRGSSLSISFAHNKNGAWHDHATGESGDVFTLIKEIKGLEYKEALEWLAEKYTSCQKQKWEPGNITPKTSHNVESSTSVLMQPTADYFVNTRKVSVETLFKYNVRSLTGNPNVAVFPHYQNGHVTKLMASDTTQKKFWGIGDSGNGLFGANFITPELTKGILTVCEGQNDALALCEAGCPSVSIPSGVSNKNWIKDNWEYLAQFHKIILCFDMDEAGQDAAAEVAKRIGLSKTLITSLPLKDASDMLQAGQGEELKTCIENSKTPEKSDIISAEKQKDKVKEILKTDMSKIGTPWFLEGLNTRLRPNELVVIYSTNSHGKSTLVSQQVAYMAAQGVSTTIASMEMSIDLIMAQMLLQYTGDAQIAFDDQRYDTLYRELSEQIFFYDSMKSLTPQTVIDQFTYSYKRNGCTIFVIDNLATLSVSNKDIEAQAKTIELFREFVNEYPVTLILVAHTRKPGGGEGGKPAERTEVRGAGEIIDLCHQAYLCHKYESKQKAIAELIDDNAPEHEIDEIKQEQPDGMVSLEKDRLLGESWRVKTWIDKETKIFQPYYGKGIAMKMLAESRTPQDNTTNPF